MDDLPRLTVVVPTHARPARLAGCLRSLADLDYPRDRLEVVVVDDGSPEPPADEVGAAEHGLDVTLVSQRRAGPAAARNAGAARATGEILAFTDDDCRPDPGWLRALVDGLRGEERTMVGGRTVNALEDNPYSTAAQAIVTHLYAHDNQGLQASGFVASNNVALPTELFREVGGFDLRFPRAAAEDREFCRRWVRHGYRIVLRPEAVVRHAHPLTLTRLLAQQFEYGRGAYRYHELAAADGHAGLRPRSAAFYGGLLRFPFQDGSRRPLAVAALIGLSQVATLLGFAREGIRPRLAAE